MGNYGEWIRVIDSYVGVGSIITKSRTAVVPFFRIEKGENMADFIPGIKCDYGPFIMVPILLPGFTTYRTISSSGDYTRGFGSKMFDEGMVDDYANVVNLGPAPWSATTGWLDACGYKLYTVDGFGTKTDSGYDLIWQYEVEEVTKSGTKTVHYYIGLRLIRRKRDLTNVSVLGSITHLELGYYSDRPSTLSIGFTYRENTYNNKKYYSFGFTQNQTLSGDLIGNWVMIGISQDYFSTYNYYMPVREIEDPNEQDPDYPSKPGGGGGKYDRTSDPIAVPGLPTIGAGSLGAVTMYKLTSAEMGVFGQEMTASDLWGAVKLFFQNPQDYIIGCTLVPFTPPGDSVWYPKIGAYTFNHAYPIISAQFVEIDCGSLTIDEYWGSCFDYEPYTQITIWLPYVGYRALPVDQIMGKTIYVKYHIDCLSGDCIAFVGVSAVGPEGPDIEKILGQFSGNCAVQMPYGSVTFDQILSSGISMISGAGVFAATGGNGGGDVMANSAMSMLAGVKGEVQQGGTIGSSGGYMSAQKPYIIKRIRRQSLPENYKNLRGYPSNIYGTLSQLTGYAEVDDIQLNNIPAMEVERKEIIELLKGGVLL